LKFAEAGSLFCFVELVSGFRDNFCQKLDNSAVGVRATLAKLSQLVAKHDGGLQ
jgi:TBC1 domain family member 13